MADDSIVTMRLKKLADVTVEELESTGDTIELEEMDLMATGELEQLLVAGNDSSDADEESDEQDKIDTAELKLLAAGDSD